MASIPWRHCYATVAQYRDYSGSVETSTAAILRSLRGASSLIEAYMAEWQVSTAKYGRAPLWRTSLGIVQEDDLDYAGEAVVPLLGWLDPATTTPTGYTARPAEGGPLTYYTADDTSTTPDFTLTSPEFGWEHVTDLLTISNGGMPTYGQLPSQFNTGSNAALGPLISPGMTLRVVPLTGSRPWESTTGSEAIFVRDDDTLERGTCGTTPTSWTAPAYIAVTLYPDDVSVACLEIARTLLERRTSLGGSAPGAVGAVTLNLDAIAESDNNEITQILSRLDYYRAWGDPSTDAAQVAPVSASSPNTIQEWNYLGASVIA